jgi:hypothetical protein
MCRAILPILTVASVAAVGGWKASRAPSVEGVWRAVEVTITGPGARTMNQVQPNLAIITAKHYSRLEIHSDGPRPILADASKATADELRQVWGPVVAEAGSYETSGANVLTLHPVVAKNPAAMVQGSFTAYGYRIAGDSLWLTMQRNQQGPIVNPPTIKLVRVE